MSIPIWTRSSVPSSKVIPKAWLVLNIKEITPFAGATIVLSSHSIATPSPANLLANTSSGTSDNSNTLPKTGATILFSLLKKLTFLKPPKYI